MFLTFETVFYMRFQKNITFMFYCLLSIVNLIWFLLFYLDCFLLRTLQFAMTYYSSFHVIAMTASIAKQEEAIYKTILS